MNSEFQSPQYKNNCIIKQLMIIILMANSLLAQTGSFMGKYLKTESEKTDNSSQLYIHFIEDKTNKEIIVGFRYWNDPVMDNMSNHKPILEKFYDTRTSTNESIKSSNDAIKLNHSVQTNIGKMYKIEFENSTFNGQEGFTKNYIISAIEILSHSSNANYDNGRKYFYPIYKNNKYGFINNDGQIIIQPKYEFASEYSDGMYKVGFKGAGGLMNYTFIDSLGNVMPKQFPMVTNFNNGLARAYTLIGTNYYCTFINKKGDIVFELDNNPEKNIGSANDASNELIKYVNSSTTPRKYGFLNKKGEIVIPAKFTNAGEFHEGLCRIEIDGKYGFIDSIGNFAIMPTFNEPDDFSEGLSKVVGGYIDKKGTKVIDSYENSRAFYNGYAITTSKLNMETSYGFIDKKGNYIIKSTEELFFENAKNFSNGLAAVKIKGKWGYINTLGEIVIEPIFDDAQMFLGTFAKVSINNGVITKSGEYVIGTGYISKSGKFKAFEDFSISTNEPINNTTKENNTVEIIGTFESSWDSGGDEKSSVVFKGIDGKALYFKLSDKLENKNEFCNYELPDEEKTVKSNIGKKYKIIYVTKDNLQDNLGEITSFIEIK